MIFFGNRDFSLTGLGDLTEAIKSTSAKEIEARDRVDISLEEYESMKKRIADLEWENEQFKLFAQILKIDPAIISHCDKDSVVLYEQRDPHRLIRKYNICFDISCEELRRIRLE